MNIDEAMDNLAQEIKDYPPWLDRLEFYNKRAYVASECLMGAIVINFGMSAYMILGMHYADQTCVVDLWDRRTDACIRDDSLSQL